MICYLGSKDCIAPEMPHSRPDSIRWSLDCTTKCGLELYRRPCQHSDFAAQPGATYPQQTLCKAEKEAVIVADSNDLSRERLIEIIQNLGYTAIGVSNAAELYEKVSEYKTGCILADLMLRGVDGLVLQEKLNRTGTSLPAIFMSDTGDVNTVVQFMKNGAFNFIIKPVSEIYLKRAVICAIDESQRRNCAS